MHFMNDIDPSSADGLKWAGYLTLILQQSVRAGFLLTIGVGLGTSLDTHT